MPAITSKQMSSAENLSTAIGRLQNACSRREYCSSDVLNKALKILEGDRDAAAKVLAKLLEDGYVDDMRYARAYCRDKASLAGWGETKIRYMLKAKGLSRDVIDDAIEEIDEDTAAERLEKLLSAKLRSLKKDDRQIRLKLIRYAMGRGYSYEAVSDLADHLIKAYFSSEGSDL